MPEIGEPMNEPQNIDGLPPGGLEQARPHDMAEPKAEGAPEPPAHGASVDELGREVPLGEESFVPVRQARAPKREAPPSERVEYVVGAPAPLGRSPGASAEGRKKVEVRSESALLDPAVPGAGEDPDQVVVLEAFHKLPEARSRRAKTERRVRDKALEAYLAERAARLLDGAGEEQAAPHGGAGAKHAAAQAAPETTARTVGGRTAKLASGPAAPGIEGVVAGPSPAVVGEILARTLGGRTERILPNAVAASAHGAAGAGAGGAAGEGAIAPAIDPTADPSRSRAQAPGARSRAGLGAAIAIAACGIVLLAWLLSAGGLRRATPSEGATASASVADATAAAGATGSAALPSAAASPSTVGSTAAASTAGAAGATAAASRTVDVTPQAAAESTSARVPTRPSASPSSKPQAPAPGTGSSRPPKGGSDLLFDNPGKP
jgi:hypothetical protein